MPKRCSSWREPGNEHTAVEALLTWMEALQAVPPYGGQPELVALEPWASSTSCIIYNPIHSVTSLDSSFFVI